MKVCTRCKVEKPLTDFYPVANGMKGVRPRCMQCTRELEREKYGADAEWRFKKLEAQADKLRNDPEFYKNHRHRCRKVHLRSAYGMTLDDFDELLESQGGGCAICGKAPVDGEPRTRMVVDHCHTSGKVRGILCDLCNTAIGKFHDDPLLLEKAADYVRKHDHT